MRNKLIAIALSLGFVFSIAATLQAQSLDQLIIDVPFSFSANGANLPAGTYLVSHATTDELNTLVIRSTDGLHSAFLSSTSTGTRGSKVSFEVVGDQHFLREISTADGGHRILPSRAEARALARTNMSASNSSSSGK